MASEVVISQAIQQLNALPQEVTTKGNRFSGEVGQQANRIFNDAFEQIRFKGGNLNDADTGAQQSFINRVLSEANPVVQDVLSSSLLSRQRSVPGALNQRQAYGTGIGAESFPTALLPILSLQTGFDVEKADGPTVANQIRLLYEGQDLGAGPIRNNFDVLEKSKEIVRQRNRSGFKFGRAIAGLAGSLALGANVAGALGSLGTIASGVSAGAPASGSSIGGSILDGFSAADALSGAARGSFGGFISGGDLSSTLKGRITGD